MEEKRKEGLCKLYKDMMETSSMELDLPEVQEGESRYQQEEFLFEDGQKKTYKVYDIKTDRFVALVKLKEVSSDSARAHFLQEAKVNASLEHPNIVPIYEIDIKENDLSFCTKYIRGETLADIIRCIEEKNKVIALASLLEMFKKVCSALSHAHSLGILHLDVNPEKVYIDSFGDVLVGDWSSAYYLDSNKNTLHDFDQNREERLTGYHSPELLEGKYEDVNEASDIYSLGAILYFILFHKAPSLEMMSDEAYFKKVPRALVSICLKAMTRETKGRYKSIEALEKDLDLYRAGYATHAENLGLIGWAQLLFLRNKTLCFTFITGMIGIFVISFLFIESLQYEQNKANIAKDIAIENLELYKNEKGLRESLSNIGVDFFLNIAKESMVAHHFDDAYELLNKIPQDEFNQEQLAELHSVMGQLAFIAQKFHQASSLLNVRNSYENSLKELADQYKLKKESDQMFLSGEHLVHFIDSISQLKKSLVKDLYHYTKKKYKHLEDFVKIVEAVILLENEHVSKIHLHLSKVENKYYLDVSNNPDIRYFPGLAFMKLHGLNLSNCGLDKNKLIWIAKMETLEELNIQGCSINDFSFLTKCKSLKKVVIDKEKASDPSFMKYSKGLEVSVLKQG